MCCLVDYNTFIKDLYDFIGEKINEIKSDNEALVRYIYLLYNPLFFRMLDNEAKLELYYE